MPCDPAKPRRIRSCTGHTPDSLGLLIGWRIRRGTTHRRWNPGGPPTRLADPFLTMGFTGHDRFAYDRQKRRFAPMRGALRLRGPPCLDPRAPTVPSVVVSG